MILNLKKISYFLENHLRMKYIYMCNENILLLERIVQQPNQICDDNVISEKDSLSWWLESVAQRTLV